MRSNVQASVPNPWPGGCLQQFAAERAAPHHECWKGKEMLQTILGTTFRWYQPNGWVFSPVQVGPDSIDYTVESGPHAGRHAVQPTYYHRVAPNIELTSWYEEVGTVVSIIWYLESQTSHRFAALPAWAADDFAVLAGDNQDPQYLGRVRKLAESKPDGPRQLLSDDGYFEML
ncbi:phenolic acid decarboxylase [Streptomyces smyrnaeus]|uniref:phenolic acid decarboxylase n=1 Tax=Streptomyces smyrnaeus TaxID=1387713 RepID=UPI00369BD57D